MNNVHRGEYIECLVAELLGPEWTLPWTYGYDWAPWDLEHGSCCKLEVKQSAARQPWHRGDEYAASPSRYDIAPRTGYWGRDNVWRDQPGRPADFYVFGWQGETRKGTVDHADPEQWMFFVLPTEHLPKKQKSIGLRKLEAIVQGAPYYRVADCVERLMKERATTVSGRTSAPE